MSALPHIKVYRNGHSAEITIDGEAFPFPISERGVEVNVSTNDVPTVTLTLMAERVEVDDCLPSVGTTPVGYTATPS